jgi:hypothetical protein
VPYDLVRPVQPPLSDQASTHPCRLGNSPAKIGYFFNSLLGNSDGSKLLKATLDEEEDTDEALSELAEAVGNQKAQQAAAE